MKKNHYTEEQIEFALKQAKTGTCVREVCQKMGISKANCIFGRRNLPVWV